MHSHAEHGNEGGPVGRMRIAELKYHSYMDSCLRRNGGTGGMMMNCNAIHKHPNQPPPSPHSKKAPPVALVSA